jgi:predicted ribosome quality control (RQC) complex YloA/Tae2 family protein
LSGWEIALLVEELDAALRGSYVSNIYSLGQAQILKMRNADTERTVILFPLLGAWISEKMAGRHDVTGPFTTSLRQQLSRAKLEAVSQINEDRIIDLAFTLRGEELDLILEMIPPGNIILLDGAKKKIVLAQQELTGPHRRIVRGEPYSAPALNRVPPGELDDTALSRLLAQETRVGRALGKGLALPRKYIDEILARAGMTQADPSPPPPEKTRELRNAVEALLSESRQHTAYLVAKDGTKEIFVVKPVGGEVLRSTGNINSMVDDLFEPELLELEEPQTDQERRIQELEASLARLREEATEHDGRASALKELASRIQLSSREEALAAVREAGEAVPGELAVGLDDQGSVAALASSLYDHAKRERAESERIRAVEKTMEAKKQREIKKAPRGAAAPAPQRRTKKEWYEKFRWFTTSDGRLAIGGRDAQSNTTLLRRHLEEEDVVYHADLFGSPFFILKKGRAQTEEDVREVAKATVSFSSAWKTGLGSADAYWVNPDQVSTAAPTGEFLARGSFAIKGKKNMVNKNLVEVSVGLDPDDRIISGPEEAVALTSRAYITLVPHREKASDTAKKVLAELRKLGGVKIPLTVDDVLRALPAGGGKVVRRKLVPGPAQSPEPAR